MARLDDFDFQRQLTLIFKYKHYCKNDQRFITIPLRFHFGAQLTSVNWIDDELDDEVPQKQQKKMKEITRMKTISIKSLKDVGYPSSLWSDAVKRLIPSMSQKDVTFHIDAPAAVCGWRCDVTGPLHQDTPSDPSDWSLLSVL